MVLYPILGKSSILFPFPNIIQIPLQIGQSLYPLSSANSMLKNRLDWFIEKNWLLLSNYIWFLTQYWHHGVSFLFSMSNNSGFFVKKFCSYPYTNCTPSFFSHIFSHLQFCLFTFFLSLSDIFITLGFEYRYVIVYRLTSRQLSSPLALQRLHNFHLSFEIWSCRFAANFSSNSCIHLAAPFIKSLLT